MKKQHLRKIPVGWRTLTPTERVTRNDWMCPKNMPFTENWAQKSFNEGNPCSGFLPCISNPLYWNLKPSEKFNRGWKFIRRKSPPKSLPITPTNESVIGTEVAISTESVAAE